MGTTLTVVMATARCAETLWWRKSLGGQVFCHLRHQGLVSTATVYVCVCVWGGVSELPGVEPGAGGAPGEGGSLFPWRQLLYRRLGRCGELQGGRLPWWWIRVGTAQGVVASGVGEGRARGKRVDSMVTAREGRCPRPGRG